MKRFFHVVCLVLLLLAQHTAGDDLHASSVINQRDLVDNTGGINGSGEENKDEAGGSTNSSKRTASLGGTDPCASAITCPDCADGAAALAGSNETCDYRKDESGSEECIKVAIGGNSSKPNDMCGGGDGTTPTSSQEPTESPTKSPTTISVTPEYTYEDEGNGGAIFALLLMFVFGGVVWSNRDKMKKLLDSAEGFDGMGGESGGPASKVTKYHDLPGEENDEEWGWGEGNDNSGDVELSVTGSTGSYRDEVVHKRKTSGSFESKDLSASTYVTTPPVPSSSRVVPAPSSGGLSLSSASTRSTSDRHSPQLKSGIGLASKASPQHPKKPLVKPPLPAAATAMPTTTPSMPSAIPIPQRITSLGKKITRPPPKPKAAAPPPEDDIFASMGLSSKPKFSKATPGTAKLSVAASPSRWTTPSNTGLASQTKTTTPSALSAGFGDDSAGDDDWGDDDDLNDLLDD